MIGSGFDAFDIRVGFDAVEECRQDNGIEEIDRSARDACVDETFIRDDADGPGVEFPNEGWELGEGAWAENDSVREGEGGDRGRHWEIREIGNRKLGK